MGTHAQCSHGAPDRPPQTLLAVEVGGFRLALTRNPASARPRQTRPFGLGAVAGLTVATLALAGASAAPRPDLPSRYLVTVDVPPPVAHAVRPTGRPAPVRATKRAAPVVAAADASFQAADLPYVAHAMATGEFQEWEGADGALRFLTAGPARVEGGRTCRDMALLVRLAEGGSRVRSAERCTTEPVRDTAPPADLTAQDPVLQD
jgi:hypothetical protein